jgi:hypothetical protein
MVSPDSSHSEEPKSLSEALQTGPEAFIGDLSDPDREREVRLANLDYEVRALAARIEELGSAFDPDNPDPAILEELDKARRNLLAAQADHVEADGTTGINQIEE